MVQYAMIIAAIAVSLIIAIQSLRVDVQDQFDRTSDVLLTGGIE